MKEFDNGLDKKFKFDFSAPNSSNVDINKLKAFLKKDKNPTIIFYGGEPLLEIGKIKEIMDNINVPFRMQTNGLLLNKLPQNYLNKTEKILVSIDGNKERTDFNRGKGTYERLISNLKQARKKGYSGEIIARMVISQEFPDIFEQIKYLVENKDFAFTSIHWQLDAGFYKFDFNKRQFEEFVKQYNKGITKLINWWVEQMQKTGQVLRLYPFLAIASSLLNNEKTLLRCGAGHSGYAISTNGKIIACPIMNCITDFEAGHIESTSPKELKKFDVSNQCISCSYRDLCGGRCLYWNKAELWPKEGDELICNTIKHLIDELKSSLPKIKSLIQQGIIKKEDFSYEKYFGPEIIP
jgi:putative peptide-modifying radical SAM enzyme